MKRSFKIGNNLQPSIYCAKTRRDSHSRLGSVPQLAEVFSPLSVRPRSKLLRLSNLAGEVVVWDIDRNKERWRLPGHEGEIWFLFAFSADGRRLFCGDGKTVKIWDLDTGRLQFDLEAHTEGILAFRIAPDSRMLTTVSNDRTVKRWGAASEEEVQQLRKRWRETQRRQKSFVAEHMF